MKYYDKITPDGTRDLLFSECALKNETQKRLAELFEARGYGQVMTPAIEFYDVFGASGAYFLQEDMYKLTDNHGRLMVLRPDCTIPIARLTATRLTGMPMPLRLYYCQSVYRLEHSMRGKMSEMFQTGVELIGSNSLRSDLEIVELASAGLSGMSENFRIELCHIGYFKALMDSLSAGKETKEEIRKCIEQKNYPALSDILEQFEGERAVAALKYLPRLFGGEEVFAQAYELFGEDGQAKESLDYLRSIYKALCRLGLSQRVIIDLGLVNQADYYTGIIFRGYFDGVGEPVLSGGRYDNLLHDFGVDLPATGFAINLDPAIRALTAPQSKPVDILVFAASEAHMPQAINYMKSLIENGLRVENYVYEEFDAAVEYAKQCGIRQLHVVDDDIEFFDVETL